MRDAQRARLLSMVSVLLLPALAGCSELSFAELPPDAELVIFASTLSEGSERPPECASLFCWGISVRVVTRACLGLGDAPRGVVDGEAFTATLRESDVSPELSRNGYLEPGGWRFEGVAFECGMPGMEYWPGSSPPVLDEHEVVLEGDGVQREVRLSDDGEVLSCGFPSCRLTGQWETREGVFVY